MRQYSKAEIIYKKRKNKKCSSCKHCFYSNEDEEYCCFKIYYVDNIIDTERSCRLHKVKPSL